MRHLRFFLIAGLSAFFIANGFVHENRDRSRSIQVTAKPFIDFEREDAQRRAFGALQFRGGLELSSSDPGFGGISALRVQDDGENFLALSDRAHWLRGRIVYSGNRPTGLADTVIAPVVGPDGTHEKRWDTESIAIAGGRLYMGVEGFDRIPYFTHSVSGFPVYQNSIPFPPGLKDLPLNGGLEAMEFVPNNDAPGGILVAISENGLDKDGNLTAYCINESVQKTFAVKRSGKYNISDAALLAGKHLLILERKYDAENGVSVRIRKISLDSIRQDALVDGPVVVEADMRYQVDNMEAISVHRDSSGEAVLTLVSDDNFSAIQRTLLLQFAYRE